MSESRSCAVCGQRMFPAQTEWVWSCRGCGFLASDLWDADRWQRKESALDETQRRSAIKKLRQSNARRILELLGTLRNLPGASLCDIGCGYGWFLEEARKYGLNAVGIEPEDRIASQAAANGFEIIHGLFPAALESGRIFDILIFNDVLEHIPNPEAAVKACAQHLSPDGTLAIAIPSSDGFFYRLASALSRFGVVGPFERMWQKNFHSPHVSYFNSANLNTLVSRNGFKLELETALPAIELSGLWSRLRMDSSKSLLSAVPLWIAITAAAPSLRLLPADIILQMYRRG